MEVPDGDINMKQQDGIFLQLLLIVSWHLKYTLKSIKYSKNTIMPFM